MSVIVRMKIATWLRRWIPNPIQNERNGLSATSVTMRSAFRRSADPAMTVTSMKVANEITTSNSRMFAIGRNGPLHGRNPTLTISPSTAAPFCSTDPPIATTSLSHTAAGSSLADPPMATTLPLTRPRTSIPPPTATQSPSTFPSTVMLPPITTAAPSTTSSRPMCRLCPHKTRSRELRKPPTSIPRPPPRPVERRMMYSSPFSRSPKMITPSSPDESAFSGVSSSPTITSPSSSTVPPSDTLSAAAARGSTESVSSSISEML